MMKNIIEFAKIKSILKTPKPKLNYKIRLLKRHVFKYCSRLRDLDNHVRINLETIHLCKNMLSYHAEY